MRISTILSSNKSSQQRPCVNLSTDLITLCANNLAYFSQHYSPHEQECVEEHRFAYIRIRYIIKHYVRMASLRAMVCRWSTLDTLSCSHILPHIFQVHFYVFEKIFFISIFIVTHYYMDSEKLYQL